MQVIHSIPPHPRSKAFIQPKLIPPVHRDQVAEPLMCKLMCYHIDDSVLIFLIGGIFVEEYSGRAVCYQSPILHCAV